MTSAKKLTVNGEMKPRGYYLSMVDPTLAIKAVVEVTITAAPGTSEGGIYPSGLYPAGMYPEGLHPGGSSGDGDGSTMTAALTSRYLAFEGTPR